MGRCVEIVNVSGCSFWCDGFFLDPVSLMLRCFYSRVYVVYTEYIFNILSRNTVSVAWEITQTNFDVMFVCVCVCVYIYIYQYYSASYDSRCFCGM